MLGFPHLTSINAFQCQHKNKYLQTIFLSDISYRDPIRPSKLNRQTLYGQTLKKNVRIDLFTIFSYQYTLGNLQRNYSTNDKNKKPKGMSDHFFSCRCDSKYFTLIDFESTVVCILSCISLICSFQLYLICARFRSYTANRPWEYKGSIIIGFVL